VPTVTGGLRSGELVYGLVVAVDITGFSALGVLEQSASQTLLGELLDDAASAVGVDRWRCRQPRGDGELAVLPADTDVASIVGDWTHHLVGALRSANSAHPRMRIRVAMHHGPLTAGRFGPVGEGPIVASRLLDAQPTRAALATDPSSDLVLVVSRQLYLDVVVTGFRGIAADRFRPMSARIKGRNYTGFLCLGTPRR
jgi:hypothetical protein